MLWFVAPWISIAAMSMASTGVCQVVSLTGIKEKPKKAMIGSMGDVLGKLENK